MVSAAAGTPRSPSLVATSPSFITPSWANVGIFQMMHDQRTEILGVGQHVAHHLGAGEARFAVGEGYRAGAAQKPDLAHLLAEQPLGHGGHGMDVDERRVAGAPQDEIDQRHVVDHRVGIRHADDCGDAAGRSGAARGGQGLAMLVAGLAGEHHHVDEAGDKHKAGAIDDLGIAGAARGDMRPEIGNETVPDQQRRQADRSSWPDRSAAH